MTEAHDPKKAEVMGKNEGKENVEPITGECVQLATSISIWKYLLKEIALMYFDSFYCNSTMHWKI